MLVRSILDYSFFSRYTPCALKYSANRGGFVVSTVTPNQEVLESGTWQADAAHSRVEFAVDYLTGTFRGTFSPFAATLEVGEDGNAVLRGSTSAASIKVQDENLAGHLQSPDFFDAERT